LEEDEDDLTDKHAGDSDWFPDEDVVRDYQRRVLMFDFFHAKEVKVCEACGVGEGYRKWRRRGNDETEGFRLNS